MTKIINLTPHDFTLIGAEGVNDAWGRNASITEQEKVVLRSIAPRQDDAGKAMPANVRMDIVDAPSVDDIPAKRTKYGEIDGLPDFEEGTMYIVSLLVISAAKEAGRTTADLLTPAGVVRDSDNPSKVIGALGVNRN